MSLEFDTVYVQLAIVYFLLCFALTTYMFKYYSVEPAAHPDFHEPDYEPPAAFMRLDKNPGVYETLKTTIMTMVVPLRLISVVGALLIVYVFCKIVVAGEDLSRPISPTKRNLVKTATQYGSALVLLLMGFWVTVDRTRQSPPEVYKTAGVLCGNHISWLDILLCNNLFGTAFIAKAATTKVPISGFLAQAQQCCFVSKAARMGTKGESKVGEKKPKSTTAKIIERQQEPEKWPQLLIFPEGTTTNGEYMTVFRSGAFVAGKPVQPIAIEYWCNHFHLAYESIYGIYHIFRTLTQVVNFAKVTVLPVYNPNEEEQANPKMYAKNVGAVIANHLHITPTTFTFNDKLRYLKYLRGDDEKRAKKQD